MELSEDLVYPHIHSWISQPNSHVFQSGLQALSLMISLTVAR